MNKKSLEKYAEMKDFQKAYLTQVKEQEGIVLKAIKRAGFTTVKIPVGTFTIMQYPSYEYSQPLRAAEENLKTLQKLEREHGIAKVVGETEGVRFTPSKESHV